MKKIWLVVVLAILVLIGVLFWHFENLAHQPKISILFIGNSFTSENDLPGTLVKIAASKGEAITYDSEIPGGAKLSDQVNDSTTLAKIKSRQWDYVVLQDQSQLPSFQKSQFDQQTVPYASELNALIHQNDPKTQVIFYETWGYQDGDSMNCKIDPAVCTYTGMQSRLITNYEFLTQQNSAMLAPVGQAWSQVRASDPAINLYESDGKHPSVAGTYLAASVFYAEIFHESPVGANRLGLNATDSQTLQTIAFETVMSQ